MNGRLQSVFNFFEDTLPCWYGSREIRNSQVQMAVDIAGVLATDSKYKTILIDAPVGTGKTFAVLISALHDQNADQITNRIIYATASLNLQAQLKNEELKILKELGCVRNFIVAKGKTHYICRRRLDNLALPGYLYDELMEFCEQASEGERTEFERNYHSIEDSIWHKINMESRGKCKHCELYRFCPTFQYRNRFNDIRNQVVITNHNQLVQSVLNSLSGLTPIINYKRTGIVIIDEAHDFEDACLSQVSKQVTFNEIARCCKGTKFEKEINKAVNVLKNFARRTRQKLDTASGRHNLEPFEKNALRQIEQILDRYLASQLARGSHKNKYFQNRVEEYEDPAERIYDAVNSAMNTDDYVNWLDIDENNESLVVVTKDFKKEISKIVSTLAVNNKLIFTSGTLAVNGSFDHLFNSWGGAPPSHTTAKLNTIFDYTKQAIVYLPENIPVSPSITSPEYDKYCLDLSSEILKLIKITGGRTLILCTAHKQMDLLYNFLKSDLSQMNINFLKQGNKSIELLSEDFKSDETSVLIGSGSFFTGLSVKGDALISVILCKLPFPPKDDPFLKLIADGMEGKEKMKLVDFPRMLIKLLQAGGRLIRSIEDYGCFSILDPRIHNKSYSSKIIEQLKGQKYNLTTSIEDVKKFIDNHKDKKGFASYPLYNRDEISVPDTLLKVERRPIIADIYSTYERNKKQSHKMSLSTFTTEQIAFYREIRMIANLKTELLKNINEPYDMFKHLYMLSVKKLLPVDIIGKFPYASDDQKSNFLRRIKSSNRSSKVVTYKLSPEELRMYIN